MFGKKDSHKKAKAFSEKAVTWFGKQAQHQHEGSDEETIGMIGLGAAVDYVARKSKQINTTMKQLDEACIAIKMMQQMERLLFAEYNKLFSGLTSVQKDKLLALVLLREKDDPYTLYGLPEHLPMTSHALVQYHQEQLLKFWTHSLEEAGIEVPEQTTSMFQQQLAQIREAAFKNEDVAQEQEVLNKERNDGFSKS